MSSHAALSAASDDRKARLAKLKSLKRKQPGADDDEDQEQQPQQSPQLLPSEETAALPHDITPTTTTTLPRPNSPTPPTTDVARLHLSGRNYDPSTRGAKLGFEAPPTLGLAGPTLEEQARELEAKSRAQQEQEQEGGGAGGGDAAGGGTSTGVGGIDLFKLQPKKPNWDLKRELGARMEVLNVRTENAIARLVRERLAEKKQAAAAAGAGAKGGEGDAEADGMLDGAAIVEGIRLREREEEEEARREREAEAEEFAVGA